MPASGFAALDLDLQAALRGTSAAVLVEGDGGASDSWLLMQLLRPLAGQVTFYGRGGRLNVVRDLGTILPHSPPEQIFAIVDRDFGDDEQVETCYAPDYGGHLFLWRRFTIENYLLEPAWIADAVEEFYMHAPERIPKSLRTAEATERFLFDWCRRLTPQVAGSWVISGLTREATRRSLPVEGRQYFDDLTDRDAAWVLAELTRKYGGWSRMYPELFSVEALKSRFEERLERASAQVQSLSDAHKVVSGKTLMKALYVALPAGPKPGKEYIRNRLVRMASKQVPVDIRALVEERILPRWRRARARQPSG